MDDLTKSNDSQYLLAALIEIYRGNRVYLPEFDREMEKNLLRDVFSAAISFAQYDESRKTISDEIFECINGNTSVKKQAELAPMQTPDVLNAKMVAAAHVMKLDSENFKRFS